MSMTYKPQEPPEATATAPAAMSSTKQNSTLVPYVNEPPPLPPPGTTEEPAYHPLATVTDLPTSPPTAESPAKLAWPRSFTPETPCQMTSSPSWDTSSHEATRPSPQPSQPQPPIQRQPSRVFLQATTPPVLPPTSTSFFDPVSNRYQLPPLPLPPPRPVMTINQSPLPRDQARRWAIMWLERRAMFVRVPCLVTEGGEYRGNAEGAEQKLFRR